MGGDKQRDSFEQMKWWGWGVEGSSFDMDSKPELWPFILGQAGLSEAPAKVPPVPLDSIELAEPRRVRAFLDAIAAAIPAEQIRDTKDERIVHAYGKSFRDLWRIRRGIVEAAPDCVVYPDNEEQVAAVIQAATLHDVIVIPYGGGSNIAGCLEAKQNDGRMVVSLDMKRMDRVLDLDEQSMTARIQAGALGPRMEEQLNARGFTLGHFPDSFVYSTVGGWVATRSAGMQSDKYGKIEDMVIALRMVTPSGTIVTRPVPKSSDGIDVNHLCIGSEGILGVITEVTLQVHRMAERRALFGYLFPDFESGARAMEACLRADCTPMLVRFNDPGKTQLSIAFRSKSSPGKALLSKAIKSYLAKVKGFKLENSCLMLTGFEGTAKQFAAQKKQVTKIYKEHGAFYLGEDPGKTFERGKYDFPHLRDYIMDHGIMADVSETCTVWSNLLPLYTATMQAAEQAIRDTGVNPFIGCHISHTYHTGASLYFTFGCVQKEGRELEQYLYIKKAVQDAFIKGGATLSHHHAVGTEHQPWIDEAISPTGVKAVQALKDGLDPKSIMNPGKIVPLSRGPRFDWGLSDADIAQLGGAATSATSDVRA